MANGDVAGWADQGGSGRSGDAALQRIGRFDTLRVLGYGAHSTIYAVQDSRDNRLYALKHVIGKDKESERFLRQAINEYEVGRRVQHPVLRRCFELKRRRELLKVTEVLLLMELVEGRTLLDYRPHRLYELVEIFSIVADALHALHETGYLHADMKPGNIMLTREEAVKVIDYGQSCRVGTVKKRIQGTPDYIAPEQVRRRELTPQTDVFNLAATLYWCLTNQYASTMISHDGEEPRVRRSSEIKPPIEVCRELPLALNQLVMQCLRTRPQERPADMREVHDRLQLVMKKLDPNQPTLALEE